MACLGGFTRGAKASRGIHKPNFLANSGAMVISSIQRIRLSSSPELKRWHPYDTALDTVMRRLIVGVWQVREITPEELRAHVEQRQAAWLRGAEIDPPT